MPRLNSGSSCRHAASATVIALKQCVAREFDRRIQASNANAQGIGVSKPADHLRHRRATQQSTNLLTIDRWSSERTGTETHHVRPDDARASFWGTLTQ